MTEITVVDKDFNAHGKLDCSLDLSHEQIHMPVVHQVVKATLAGRRQGNACTKTRSEVRGGGRKPFKQKGTGRARQGSSRSPILVGGGTAFGPKPRDYSQKINKKVMKKAIHAVIADKYQAGKLVVIDGISSDGKTKTMYKELNERGFHSALVVTQAEDNIAIRALRNIPKAKGLPQKGFSVYEALKYEFLIIEKSAFEALVERVKA